MSGRRAGCSCTFRHLAGWELGFDEPQDWFPEEQDNLQATAELYRVIASLVQGGHRQIASIFGREQTLPESRRCQSASVLCRRRRSASLRTTILCLNRDEGTTMEPGAMLTLASACLDRPTEHVHASVDMAPSMRRAVWQWSHSIGSYPFAEGRVCHDTYQTSCVVPLYWGCRSDKFKPGPRKQIRPLRQPRRPFALPCKDWRRNHLSSTHGPRRLCW